MAQFQARQAWQLCAARWRALLQPAARSTESLGLSGTEAVSTGLQSWQQRWQPVLAEARGPAAHFADHRYWQVEHGMDKGKATGREWITGATCPKVVAKALLEAASESKARKPRSAMDDPLPEPHLKVLHVGCGTSALGLELAALGHEVVESDSSEDAIKNLQTLSSSLELKGTRTFEVADATSLPQEWAETFDIVVEKGLMDSLMCGGHADAAGALQEMGRVCKSDGVILSVSDEGVAPMRLEFMSLVLDKNWRLAHTTMERMLGKAQSESEASVLRSCNVYIAARRAKAVGKPSDQRVVMPTSGRSEGQQKWAMALHGSLSLVAAAAYFYFLKRRTPLEQQPPDE